MSRMPLNVLSRDVLRSQERADRRVFRTVENAVAFVVYSGHACKIGSRLVKVPGSGCYALGRLLPHE